MKEYEEKFRSLIESTSDWIWEVDNNGIYTFTSENVKYLLGYDPEEIIGKSFTVFLQATESKRIHSFFKEKSKLQKPFSMLKNTVIHKDGHSLAFELSGVPFFDKKGDLSGWRGINRDITQRNKAEEELRNSEERFRTIAAMAKDGIVIIDNNSEISYWNQAAKRIFGYASHEAIGKDIHQLLAPAKYSQLFKKGIDSFKKTGKGAAVGKTLELEAINKDGEEFPIELSLSALKLKGQWHAVGIIRDISVRKNTERKLREEEEKLRLIFEHARDAIFWTDAQTGRIINCNKAAENLLEKSRHEIIGASQETLHPMGMAKEQNAIFQRHIFENSPTDFDAEIITKSKKIKDVQITYSVTTIGEKKIVQGIFKDVTEKKKLEKRLALSQKMEAVGTLAGGIAHEFNNALAGVMGYTELLQMEFPDDEKIEKYGRFIKKSSQRMSTLTAQLLAYARGGKYRAKVFDIKEIIDESLQILKHSINPLIKFKIGYISDALFFVKAEKNQIRMVLSAILTNASEAMDRSRNGLIRINVTKCEVDENFALMNLELSPGSYCCLTVEDSGKGMHDDVKRRIFEPFFTTKFQGRGLGMAAAYGIIKNHFGNIQIDSEPGKGTRVSIFLPLAVDPANASKRPAVEIAEAAKTILLVEDEQIVMDVTLNILEKLGYQVLTAKTGKEAIKISKKFHEDIDLVLLDIKLPDMDGAEIYHHIKMSRQDIKVMVCSGYELNGPIQEILDSGACDFIQKPYDLETLTNKIRNALNGV